MTESPEFETDISIWLKELRIQDFGWERLPKIAHVWSGTSQQDFWRKSPNGHNRTDEELLSQGYLIDVGDGRLFHIANVYPHIYDKIEDYFESIDQYSSILDQAWRENQRKFRGVTTQILME